MMAVLYFILFGLMNVGTIYFVWIMTKFVHPSYSRILQKLMFFTLMSSLVFSGNVVVIAGITVNLGIFFVLNYYLIGFILCDAYGPVEYTDMLKEHFYLLLAVSAMTLPMILLNGAGVVFSGLSGLNNLINDVLAQRINYMAILAIVFYIGQLSYAHSFSFIERRSFWFEFLVRLPVMMTLQSLLFYGVQLVALSQTPISIIKIVHDMTYLIINGLCIRYAILILASLPFYRLYNSKKEDAKKNALSV